MRKELPGTYQLEENGNLLVSARDKGLELLQFSIDRDELTLQISGRVIELRPVVGKVTLITSTPEMERVMAAAGKGCYSNRPAAEIFPELTSEQAQYFLRNQILPSGHFSVTEHGSFTFGIEGVSRALTHQLVRHRLASYSQQSQRYTNPIAEKIERPVFKFIVPPNIRCSEERFLKYSRVIKEELRAYAESLQEGVKEEDARMLLPNGAGTNITMSVNARALYEIATKRTCALAQWEIDMILTQMVLLAAEKAPSVFETAGPECSRTKCHEGKRSCGVRIDPLVKYAKDGNFPHDHLIFGMK